MHAVELLHKWSEGELSDVNGHRRRTVWTAVEALLRGRQLWLSALGRAVGGGVDEKHSIKRMDRLLGNAHLSDERLQWYRFVARQVLGSNRRPVIAVDWTDLDDRKELFLLRASVSVGGRALPVYEEVHDSYGDTRWHRRFLSHLAQVLGPDCAPIVVSDAGFRVWWFKLLHERGWDYVGRVRNREYVRWQSGGRWFPNRRLHARATRRAKRLGAAWLSKLHQHAVTLYLYRGSVKKRVKLNREGRRARGPREEKIASAYREPWLLASNLGRLSARKVVALYRRRVQIEEAFRDLKAPRHGFAFRLNLGRNRERVANLMLLAALAMRVTWLVGLLGQEQGLVNGLQANTVRKRRVLSVFFVGSRLIAQGLRCTASQLRQAMATLHQHVAEQSLCET